MTYRTIADYDGYRFGSDGSIWSRWELHGYGWPCFGSFATIGEKWKLLKQHPRKDGYMHVNLRRAGGGIARNLRVSHLILLAFGRKRPSPTHEAMHIDDTPSNNAIRNLKWGTRIQNAHDCRDKGRMRNQHTAREAAHEDRRRKTTPGVQAARHL